MPRVLHFVLLISDGNWLTCILLTNSMISVSLSTTCNVFLLRCASRHTSHWKLFYPAKNKSSAAMYTKRFNLQSPKKKTTQGVTESFLGYQTAATSIQMLLIVE